MSRLSPALLALPLVAAMAGAPAEAAQRAFVSSSGNDANTATGCGLAAPFRSFASAQTVVNDGGEIVALDGAGYGAITVTKNVTITANPGFYAGIGVATGSGVTIATAGINVILRGLNINGTGGTNGVVMTNGARLSIENCVISNFAGGYGLYVDTQATVRVIDSLVRDNGFGVLLQSGATAIISGSKIVGNVNVGVYVSGATDGTTTTAAVNDTVVSGSSVGVGAQGTTPIIGGPGPATAQISMDRATVTNNSSGVESLATGGTTVVTLSNSMVTGNVTGLQQSGTATLRSLVNNTVDQNGTAATGTITPLSPM
jgi:Right handed beta helix region